MSTVSFDAPGPLKIRTPSSDSNGRPKPCLKSLPTPEYSDLPFSSYPLHSPHVHFPPTPTLTSTNFTHSSVQYDRAPIVVTENVCALPERGGRSYNAQPRGKRSSRRGSPHHRSGPDVGIAGVEGGRALASSEPINSYFHPRAFEACEPDHYLKDQYNPYFAYSSSSDSSSSSSSSSESESDSDYSYGPLSPTSSSSIPRAAMNALALVGAPASAYPSNSPYFTQQQTGSQQSRQQFSHSSLPRHSYQQPMQLSHNVLYPQPPNLGLAECKPKKPATSGGRKVKGSSSGSSSTSPARLAKFGGGFSDQSMVLEGCLGGF
ncbi:hypothetical protein NP233_g10481 [Leucocoprinus birnbaumii]|uniref:Uncharacterized protein n=1 Tax=Leucocoprinus birnbaumii TaxID=56174 RepID=A0AAD5YM49_9AGAR|nr:hypothetical protein NP233_g10481 [Leucocoprinus birnbaumii]